MIGDLFDSASKLYPLWLICWLVVAPWVMNHRFGFYCPACMIHDWLESLP